MALIDKDQIRAEIERQIKINKRLLNGRLKVGCLYAFHQIISFLDNIPEQPASKELEVSAEEYSQQVKDTFLRTLNHPTAKECFIAGAEWGMNQCPLPEDTTIFMKGVAEGRRLEKDDNISLIESRIDEILGDAQPAPVLRMELQGIIDKIKEI